MDEKKIKLLLREFATNRDWKKFHTPKNLVCALSVEASELVEIFQWDNYTKSEIQQNKHLNMKISDEVADIMLYLIRFTDIVGIDIERVCLQKIKKNEKKYPIHLSKGKSTKYNEIQFQQIKYFKI